MRLSKKLPLVQSTTLSLAEVVTDSRLQKWLFLILHHARPYMQCICLRVQEDSSSNKVLDQHTESPETTAPSRSVHMQDNQLHTADSATLLLVPQHLSEALTRAHAQSRSASQCEGGNIFPASSCQRQLLSQEALALSGMVQFCHGTALQLGM